MRPRLLDLFCGAGGCAVGYHRTGFDVVGVDIRSQPNYPYRFHQGDALEVLEMILAGEGSWALERFDAVHASPPCQAFSIATLFYPGARDEHLDLVEPTRRLLDATGLPYVIENVPGAPIRKDVLLCGVRARRPPPPLLRDGRLLRNAAAALAAPHEGRTGQLGAACGICAVRGRPLRRHAGRVTGNGHRLDEPRGTGTGHPAGVHRAHRPVPHGGRHREGRRMMRDTTTRQEETWTQSRTCRTHSTSTRTRTRTDATSGSTFPIAGAA